MLVLPSRIGSLANSLFVSLFISLFLCLFIFPLAPYLLPSLSLTQNWSVILCGEATTFPFDKATKMFSPNLSSWNKIVSVSSSMEKK